MKKKDLLRELRAISVNELSQRLERLRLELAKFYMKSSIKRLEKVSLIRNHRKEIAQINTVITEKRALSS